MDEAGTKQRRARARWALPLAAAGLALLLAWGPALAAAQKKGSKLEFKSGTFRGKTVQESVNVDHRRLEFRIKKGKVTLLTEPVIRRGFCLSPPVFTLEDEEPVKPLSKGGAFSFTRTFLGTKIDKITGRYVGARKIRGLAVYNFAAAEECAAGVAKVKFTVTLSKKKKKK
ncbi:MAG: hypothetical protein ACRDL6_04300 [Solirubrobacterales bacterium]